MIIIVIIMMMWCDVVMRIHTVAPALACTDNDNDDDDHAWEYTPESLRWIVVEFDITRDYWLVMAMVMLMVLLSVLLEIGLIWKGVAVCCSV